MGVWDGFLNLDVCIKGALIFSPHLPRLHPYLGYLFDGLRRSGLHSLWSRLVVGNISSSICPIRKCFWARLR